MEAKPTTLAKAYDLALQEINEIESLNVLNQSRAPPIPTQPYFQRERFTTYQRPTPIQHQVQTTFGPPPPPQRLKPSMSVRDRLGPPNPPRPDRRPELALTRFTLSRATILNEIKGKPFYLPPPPMFSTTDERPKDKHCNYHETHGHHTDNYLALKYFSEKQLKMGNLSQYLPRQTQGASTSQYISKNVVNTVFG